MNQVWSESDGQRLKACRLAAGLGAAVLAKLNALSHAQLLELEDGGQGSFYSAAIKAQVGRKLLLSLGADGHGVTADLHPMTKAIAELEMDKVAAQARQNLDPNLSQRIGRAVLTFWRTRDALSAYVLAALSFCLILLSLKWLTAISEQIDAKDISAPPLGTLPIEQNHSTNQAPLSKNQSPQNSGPSNAAVIAASGLLTASASEMPSTRDCDIQDQGTVIQSAHSGKPSNYVHLVASRATGVCVADSRNQVTPLALTAGEAKTVYGAAPWRLSSNNLASLNIFFQGQRIALPDSQTTQIRLHAHLTK